MKYGSAPNKLNPYDKDIKMLDELEYPGDLKSRKRKRKAQKDAEEGFKQATEPTKVIGSN